MSEKNTENLENLENLENSEELENSENIENLETKTETKSDGLFEEDELLNSGNIVNLSVEKEIRQSYIDYAMAVIVNRALPDIRDGFKPVHRRILYAMYDMKMFYNTKHKKSARIVGEVLGKFHPHGDSSVYEAMVRLAQYRSMRYPLVDGQGNFGSQDGDGPAAMRYTEAKMTKLAEEMLEDIGLDTVDRRDNFDGSLKEPMMLPTKFPNHLCNGTMGIAVGMATNMPPHNLTEVIDACLLAIEKEDQVSTPSRFEKPIVVSNDSLQNNLQKILSDKNLVSTMISDDFVIPESKIQKYKEIYERDKDELIYVTAVIKNEKGEILILNNKQINARQIPAGKVDKGESLEDGLVREMKEELGIDIKTQNMRKIGITKNLLGGIKRQGHIFEVESYEGEIKIQESEKDKIVGFERFNIVDSDNQLGRAIQKGNEIIDDIMTILTIYRGVIWYKMATNKSLKYKLDNATWNANVDSFDLSQTYIQYWDKEKGEYGIMEYSTNKGSGPFVPKVLLIDAVHTTLVKNGDTLDNLTLNKELVDYLAKIECRKIMVTMAPEDKILPVIAGYDFELFTSNLDPELKKTNPEYYKKLLSEKGIQSEDVFYFDHSDVNISSAKEAGILNCVKYENNDQIVEILDKEFKKSQNTAFLPAKQEFGVTIDDIMDVVKGPDFPTGGYIFDTKNIREVYRKGRGGIICRGKVHMEEDKKHGKIIVIDEIPYQVNKGNLVEKIGNLVMEKKIEGINDVRDESSKEKIRITIYLNKGVSADRVLVLLYKFTELQTSFNINNVALVENGLQPRTLNIKDMILEFVKFRRYIVRRRSEFLLIKARDRLHILEGLKKAIDIIDDVIYMIRHSDTKAEAKEKLMAQFDFTDPQAEHILMMRLQSLVGLEMQKITDEINEKIQEIMYLEDILQNPKKLDNVVSDELIYIKDTYGDVRRTQVIGDETGNVKNSIKALMDQADRIKEDCIVWIGSDYSVKMLYQTRIMNIPENTIDLVYTHNQDNLIVITDIGELVVIRLKDLGACSNIKDNPRNIKKEYGLKGTIVFAKTLHFNFEHLLLITDQNNIKKIDKNLVLSFKKFPTIIMNLPGKNEKIVSVLPTNETDKVGVLTTKGILLIYKGNEVRPMGKTSGGVKTIDLAEGDSLAGAFLYRDEPFIFVYSKDKAKLLNVQDDLRIWKRGKRGDQIVENLGKDKILGGIAIDEGAITLKYQDNSQEDIHSNDVLLDIPDADLAPIGKKSILTVFRPRGEKAENTKYKEDRKNGPEMTEEDVIKIDGLFDSVD